MKVFVSHSSKDKWAARRIAEDLHAIDVETFLDEKDIATGESIDAAIRKHLGECDDFLILLSPASVASEWVLIELGGALALNKNVIPILLYVGVNEVPKAINLKLARDINDVSKYYHELGEKSGATVCTDSDSSAPEDDERAHEKDSNLKPGVPVTIIAKRPPDSFEQDLPYAWIDEMDTFLGKKTTITRDATGGGFKLEIDNGKHGWVSKWLVRVSDA